MVEETKTKISLRASIRRLLQLSGRNQIWLYTAMAMAVLNTALTVASMLCVARFIDAVTANRPNEFFTYLALTAIFFLLTVPVEYLRTRSIGLFSERTMARLREKIAAQATVLPMRYLEERHTGDFLSVVNADLSRLQKLTATSLLNAVAQTVMAVGALGTLIFISWQLALVSTLMMPVMFLVMSKLSQPVAQRSNEMQEAIGETLSIAQDGLAGLMVTKAFNLVGVMDGRFEKMNQTALGKGLLLARLRAATDGGGWIFGVLPFLITFGYGGYLTINGFLTFGSLMAFINMLNYVANPLSDLPPIIANIGEASGAAQRMFQIFDQDAERTGGGSFTPQPGAEAAHMLRMEHVHFSYGDEPILKDVNLSIRTGETVAVVGPSGGGKSTLLKLVLGYYPPESGRVFLFGHDLESWALDAVRQQMAFVAQDTYLFPVSLAENIACGKPGASQAEIEQAARMANIHDFIISLPEGYQTLAGERGARLSGGQRQRLSLARAVLKDAPILLLDEPTSALDTESEALVQEALERFMAGRTTVVIAHRLSTIRDANRVLVLEHGQIVEEGSHEELMARGGRYQELYLRQFDEPGLPAQGDSHADG
jgi:ABC-type multidrug transport system fused ATPase/permease subunit